MKVGDTVRYKAPNGWTFEIAEIKDGRIYSPLLGNYQQCYDPSDLELIRSAPDESLRLDTVRAILEYEAHLDLDLLAKDAT